MDSETLIGGMHYVAGAGIVLSTEQQTVLQTSLMELKHAEKFHKIWFWGKISGVTRDYYIAQGVTSDPVAARKSFFSLDCIKWAQIVHIHELLVATAAKVRTRFTGNPSHEYTVNEIVEASAPPTPSELASIRVETPREDGSRVVVTNLTEDKRLAAMITTLDHDVAITPRGAFKKTPTDTITANPSFSGLSHSESQNLQNYFHLRNPEMLPQKTLLERAKLDRAIDFLDTIADDTPYGVWSLQLVNGGSVVHLRSLLWPGFVFYHVVGSNKYGYVYYGIAQKNIDLPFMLP